MAASSSLKSALASTTKVAAAAVTPQKLYLNAKFEVVKNSEQKADFRALILEVGRMYGASKEVDRNVSCGQILSNLKTIAQLQEKAKAKLVPIIEVASQILGEMKSIAPAVVPSRIQQTLSGLCTGKEMLIFRHCFILSLEQAEKADAAKKTYFVNWNEIPGSKRHICLQIFSSAVMQATDRSLEAFSLFFQTLQEREKETRQKAGDSGPSIWLTAIFERFSSSLRAKLETSAHSPDSDVRTVAQAFLSFYQANQRWKEVHKLEDSLKIFDRSAPTLHKDLFMVLHMPEFVEMQEAAIAYGKKIQLELMASDDQTVDKEVLKKGRQGWQRFTEAAYSRHFVYEFYYQMLIGLQQNAQNRMKFSAEFLKNKYASVLQPNGVLPEPTAFAGFSLESVKSVPSSLPTATAVAVDEVKLPPKPVTIQKKKKTPKKDPFAYLEKTPSVTELNVKTKEPVPASAASPQTAAAASAAAPARSLSPVLGVGKAFMAQRTVDERVEIWLTDPETALKHPNYQHLSEAGKKGATQRHGIPRVIRLLLGTRYSTTGSWQNPTTGETDTLHCLVAEIEDEETGEKERSVLQYCEDKKHVIYHQFAGLTSNNELTDRLINGRLFDVLDFPDLEFSQKMGASGKSVKPVVAAVKGEEISMDPLTGFVTVRDGVHKKKYTIIPLGE